MTNSGQPTLTYRPTRPPLIYTQSNWAPEFQKVLAVEVPKIEGRLPRYKHKDLLRDRYRKLARTAVEEGQRMEDWIVDQLEVVPPSDDPTEMADSILNSTAFINLMGRRDDLWGHASIVDQKLLRQVYNRTQLEMIIMTLREIYLNFLDVEG